MNQELQLKLQAYLDGELSEQEGRHVLTTIEGDAEAKALWQELTTTRNWLRSPEVETPRAVPASREFYWSQISRAIEQGESATAETAAATGSGLRFWSVLRRYMVPVAGGAFVLFLTAAGLNYYDYSPLDIAMNRRISSKVENQSEHTSSFSFRSHAENMTVVWVYDKSVDTGVTDAAEEDPSDTVVQ